MTGAAPARPAVAVVIPARDAAATLPTTLASVLAQEPSPVEIAVAVGPSTDATAEVARRAAAAEERIVVVDNPGGRTPDALNRAIAATTAPIVARVDAHAALPAGYLARAVDTLLATGAANVGGRQVPVAEEGFAAAVALAMASPLGAGGAAYRTGSVAGPADTVYLGVFRRQALEAVGGFDPRFVRNQDAELNLRLAEAGEVVWFEPALEVAYRPRGSLRGLAGQYLAYGRYRRLTARVHPGTLRARQLAPPVLVLVLSATALASAISRRSAPLVVAASGYLGAVAAGTLASVPDRRRALPTALATATMHLSWGVGFLLGPPRGPTRARRSVEHDDG